MSNPIDIIDPISSPATMRPEGGLPDWVKWIVGILALILLLVILMPILPYIIRFVIWLISLPFKLIGAIIKGISGSKKRRRGKK